MIEPQPELVDEEDEEDAITWTKVENAIKRGATHLTNSTGYTYVVTKRRTKTIDWLCCIRNKTMKCMARVKESEGQFCSGTPRTLSPTTRWCHKRREGQGHGPQRSRRQSLPVRLQTSRMRLEETRGPNSALRSHFSTFGPFPRR